MAQSRGEILEETLGRNGLKGFGAFKYDGAHTGFLIGNAGPAMWQVFCISEEYRDGRIDPLNRWTQRILSKLSGQIGCDVIYPFDRPFPPFQRYAIAATGAKSSPLGLLIHSTYGLWHAFRGALVFQNTDEKFTEISALPRNENKGVHPCDTCLDKPCLTTCPVSAFSETSLKVDACFDHLDSGLSPTCLSLGCAARSACPIGQEYKYCSEQLAFHMKSFRVK